MQTNHDEMWKQMTTPKEIDIHGHENYMVVKDKFDTWRNQGVCVRCPMSGTIHNMPYRRSISKGMARALKTLYRIEVSKINDGTAPNQFADFTKLRYWGLIRQNDAGHWRITQNGIDFVDGCLKVAKYAIVVNNERTQFLGESISIDEVLNK